jgi:hypothetical protein
MMRVLSTCRARSSLQKADLASLEIDLFPLEREKLGSFEGRFQHLVSISSLSGSGAIREWISAVSGQGESYFA